MDFKSAKVLITGGSGFLGSHLAEALIDLGAKVVIADLPSVSTRNIGHIKDKIEFW